MNLFDIIEREEDKEKPVCPHRRWEASLTVWPGETEERMTATCSACGLVRGRWPGEFQQRTIQKAQRT